MRLRGIYPLLAVAASVAATLVLAGPAAAANLHCGQTLDSSVTLIGNLDCSGFGGPAIIIGHDGVTLNLGGNSITGGSGQNVIQNFDGSGSYVGTTIQGGTLYVSGGGEGVANYMGGGSDLTVAGVNIVGTDASSTIGVDDDAMDNLTVTGGSFSGLYETVELYHNTGVLIKGNKIEVANGYAEGYGVDSYGFNTAVSIVGNTFTTDTPQSGYGYYAGSTASTGDAGTTFSGNTVTALDYGILSPLGVYNAGMQVSGNVFGGPTPGTGNNYGIALDEYGSGDVISGNYIRNSSYYAVYDGSSFNDTYTGNIATSNGRVSNNPGYYIDNGGYGPVTMVNNVARVGNGYGFYVFEAYNSSVPGGPYSLFSGNTALANGSGGQSGFYDEFSVGATWSNNTAMANAFDGFDFYAPWRETITGNHATQNGADGFYVEANNEATNSGSTTPPVAGTATGQPTAFTNNAATSNGNYGFDAAYPLAGSGNSGGSSNGYDDCYLVAGCS